MGREWELSYRLGMRPWIALPTAHLSLPLLFLASPRSGFLLHAMPLGISGTFNYMLVFQATILMHPFHMSVCSVDFVLRHARLPGDLLPGA